MLLTNGASEQRYRVVLNLGRTRAGVAILDAYGEVAVLRAIAVRLSHRRERHGSALGAFMIQIAHELGVARLYAAAATTGFLDALASSRASARCCPPLRVRSLASQKRPPLRSSSSSCHRGMRTANPRRGRSRAGRW